MTAQHLIVRRMQPSLLARPCAHDATALNQTTETGAVLALEPEGSFVAVRTIVGGHY